VIVTAELSLYPLTENYEGCIIAFIKKLKSHSGIKVQTHAMSTFVKGESTLVFKAIDAALISANQEVETLSLVIKAITRNLPVEKGFLEF